MTKFYEVSCGCSSFVIGFVFENVCVLIDPSCEWKCESCTPLE